jgi:DNA repair protein RAD50
LVSCNAEPFLNFTLQHLQDLSRLIDEFGSIVKGDSLERIDAQLAKHREKIAAEKEALEELMPNLDVVAKAVDDQARHKKLLQDNLELIETLEEIEGLEEAIDALKKAKSEVEGYDTAPELLQKAAETVSKNEANIARLEGRRAEIIEQVRGLNRKLQSPDYADIDTRYRKEKIKYDTTQLAIKDIDHYANALDRALLKFHSIKIAEINRLIKELWLLTYKGEDITSIELESGQDSRAAKSYNYRVVMTKGSTKMDMRGRCSAGQRVLASIVIRLALAETFGVNLGCLGTCISGFVERNIHVAMG